MQVFYSSCFRKLVKNGSNGSFSGHKNVSGQRSLTLFDKRTMIKAKQAKIWCAGTCPPFVILGNPKAVSDWACVK